MHERFWESKEKLSAKLKVLESEIANLKSKLNDSNDKKEEWFKKKEELKKQLQDSIKDFKTIKIKQQGDNADISRLKQERNSYNKIVGELISKIKQLNNERDQLFQKSEIKEHPDKIRAKIEGAEREIETEAISFSREQKLMKYIKKLKTQYAEVAELDTLAAHIRQLSSDIEDAKAKAQGFHKQIQEHAHKDNGYSEFIEKSKAINNLRKEQEQAFRKFVSFKRLYIEFNNQLKVKMDELAYAKKRFDKFTTPDVVKEKDKEIAMLKDKLKDVEEKIRKGKN